MKRNILGLDLGTTSIGFAHVIEDSENPTQSSIKQIGVRVNPLTTDEQTNFEKGKPVSVNADRTLKRGARRNLDRYQQRREHLLEVLLKAGIITKATILTETGSHSTFSTYHARARAVTERIEKEELARVFLAINKKRGYKSSRKAKNEEEEGHLIDGMSIAKKLYEEKLTPGQFGYQLLKEGKRSIPDFYRSDLQAEFDQIWDFQKQFYPEILTEALKADLKGKGQRATAAIFWTNFNFNTAENKGSREEKKMRAYLWRSEAVGKQLQKEEVAYVLAEVNGNLSNSSGYLGAISDRSKELFFNRETVGQYLYRLLLADRHTSLKNRVFYRQDYLDEFEAIWTTQAKYHPELTDERKEEIRDIIIFYQRKLKSQRGLISFCEFESKDIEVEKDGKLVTKTIGLKVIPKSSPLFQEFKIWQILQNVLVRRKGSRKRTAKGKNTTNFSNEENEIFELDLPAKQLLFDELNVKGNLSADRVLDILGCKPDEWELNYTELEGNRTHQVLYDAFLKILDIEGYNEDLLKGTKEDEINVSKLKTPAPEIRKMIKDVFQLLGIPPEIMEFNAELKDEALEQQASYRLWHLLYSYEGDDSLSGDETLLRLLEQKFGFKPKHAKILASVAFVDDYGSLSAKAIRNIYPYIKENKYSTACEYAGYRHSASSLTKDEIDSRPLKPNLQLLKKNSLRNPVVEKILNQMVNVVNTLIEKENKKRKAQGLPEDFHFDEIRVELARDLKKNSKERAEMTANINAEKSKHEKILKILQTEFSIKNPTRNDIIRYKLYEELKNNGYKDLYTNTCIHKQDLFDKKIDIEHIIPQARAFDDSFSNKTLAYRQDNLKKGSRTALDYLENDFSQEDVGAYLQRIEHLYKLGMKNKEEGISRAKYLKLQKREGDIGDGFIERDLRDSQYIAKKAKEMLFSITKRVTTTTGSITNRLREDWDLINIMQELNFDKFKKLGLTEMIEKKDGTFKERIVDWSKRNDHRHHAMDALTVAFTKPGYIQYLNYLNARKDENHKQHEVILKIEAKETEQVVDNSGNKKRKFIAPMPNFRQVAKEHLENILVSQKAKNKVVTKNKNTIKTARGNKTKIELTPRGQLHKETVYGQIKQPVVTLEKVGTKFDSDLIQKVSNPLYKRLLLERLEANDNDPSKAFGGKNAPSKNPIYLDEQKTLTLPEKVKVVSYEADYTIRKDITPDLKIEKVIDTGIKRILESRLQEYNGNAKEAFSNLDKNPIWLNKEEGISIKRVSISGVKNAEAIHYKKDHLGRDILDKNGNKTPADFVSTGNNHHVAIYRDAEGNLQDMVVSFFEAVERVRQGLPVIDKTYNNYLGWQFLFTMKQNEYFVFPNDKTGFDPNEIDLLDPQNNKWISPNLFRVQIISKVSYGNAVIREYAFRHHLETSVEKKKELKDIAYIRAQTLTTLERIVKVRVNHIGEIVSIGEY